MDAGAWQAWLTQRAGDAGPRLGAVVARAAEPERAAGLVTRFAEALGEHAVPWLGRAARGLEALVALAAFSRWAGDIAVRHPGWLVDVVDHQRYRQVLGRRSLGEALERELAVADETLAVHDRLVRFRQREGLRIVLGDALGELSFESVVRELSDLADVLVQAAVDEARARLAARGVAVPPGFTVIGMGKLGGRELNYSSDIDLIFAYKAPDGDEGEAHAAFQKLGSETIAILSQHGPAGWLFRVDMRLRPEGDRGELALSARETIDYYYSVGRPWERQAMIKARAIAGDLALGQWLMGELTPWIYPKLHAWSELDHSRDMRRKIEDKASARDLKTGPGGIRDIEFMVQFFQLTHGGKDPELRGRATLPMLRVLADRGVVPTVHAHELDRHYRFLRVLEHRLQVWEDRQLHELPSAPSERESFARRCGYPGATALDASVERARARVRELVARHYLTPTQDHDAILAFLALDEVDAELATRLLAPVGFADIGRAATRIRALAHEPFFVLRRGATERSLAQLLPTLLEQIRQSPDPDETLDNFAKIVSAVGGRSTFFELLASRPAASRLFVDLAGWATFLVNLLQEFPGLPDDLIDVLNQPPRRIGAQLREARALIAGLADIAEPLRFFQARETATIAVRDLHDMPQVEVSRRLSELGLAILSVAYERVVARLGREWGFPVEGGRPTRFAVLGLGKLGSGELSYASDMDVIFVCEPGGTCHRNQRGGEEFWTRVAQELMRVLKEGRLYEIDPRLRPWGDGSDLVPNLPALTAYWAQPKDLWERMAMLRVAHLAGDPEFGRTCVALIHAAAQGAPLPADAATQVRDMRKRLEESVAGRDHVKRGPGGYVDHEFIAHFLSFGVDRAALPAGLTVGDSIRRLAELGRMSAEAAEELVEGLVLLRFVEARMRLTAGKAVSSLPTEPAARERLARRCGFSALAELDLALHLARESGRRWFDRLVR
ncbi:MAG TPA: bifunctional [glutamate--ammonia ligase]-adenylyl-L-tyrosine phosphorylase/[glutamate--ammonia-ligase] adenylyltransferase [Planctomycetota bacterium]|nr:bifunctional [glutamate--ammonia ligase]-adenylyl-L-tyrosine phosphorylase/[glutamate--ammonia-ligase] adenylyltransferase [Planctomycetota bacterium]